MVQVDRLVALLETPAFTALRLQLLQPGRQPELVRALYGILMLLPQSGAFRTLSARLAAVPALVQLEAAQQQQQRGRGASGGGVSSDWADWGKLLQGFIARQQVGQGCWCAGCGWPAANV